MRWEEIDLKAKTWVIPGARRKGGEHVVPLTDMVLQLLGKPERVRALFSTTAGKKSFSGFSKCRQALDEAVTALQKKEKRAPISERWTLHDLRRTARSLMSRAGVSADIAERALGHAIPGIRATYDRHSFFDEKKEALERLAALVERTLNPPTGNILVLGKPLGSSYSLSVIWTLRGSNSLLASGALCWAAHQIEITPQLRDQMENIAEALVLFRDREFRDRV